MQAVLIKKKIERLRSTLNSVPWKDMARDFEKFISFLVWLVASYAYDIEQMY